MNRYANIDYWGGSLAAASNGLWPKQYEIPEGTRLYRFVDLTKSPSAKAADGPWWFEYEHYQTIKCFSERHGYDFGYVARLFAAILYEWSEVNAVVVARVKTGPLLAWKGKGKQVTAKQADSRDVSVPHGAVTSPGAAPSPKMTPTQGPLEVLQLFIPGLGKPHCQFLKFMQLEQCFQIRTR